MRITITHTVPKKYRRALNYWYHRDPRPAPRDTVAAHLEHHGDTMDEAIWRKWDNRKG